MNAIKNILLLTLVLAAFTSCEKVLMQSQPEVNNLNIFDDFSKIYLEKYAMFDQKNVDWQPLSDSVRATITPETTEPELADKMGLMVARLKDGHTVLITPDSTYGFDLLAGYPINFDDSSNNFLEEITPVAESAGYKILDDNVGYIFLPSFNDIAVEDIVKLLEPLKDTRGLIIDVRINGGGDPEVAADLARRFTATRYSAGVESFKTGPGTNDFSPSEIFVNPAEEGVTYLDKKVVIIQDRLSYSATTTLIYLTDPNPNVTTLGGHSGGGSGSVTSGFLINGWIYNLSSSDFIDAKGRKIDDGVDADIPVALDPMAPETDELVAAAIDFILE